MGTLAVDIETASPFTDPDPEENNTDDYEWVAVAVGYDPAITDPSVAPETDVLFRQGGWDDDHTAALLDDLCEWCEDRDVERTLTYNGAWFDLKHMCNWAQKLTDNGTRPAAYSDLVEAVQTHIDLAHPATERHEDELRDDQPILPLWKVCQLEDIDDEKTWYDDYEIPEAYLDAAAIDQPFVRGAHVGEVLGERYVEGLEAGIEHTKTHQQLAQLLSDYAAGDVDVLFELYRNLGGEALVDEHCYPVDEVGS